MKSFTVLAALLILGTSATATQIHIPTDQPTIQAGIDAAFAGDTVVVAPGIYRVNLDFSGKAIVVTSEAGPHLTFLRPDSSRLPIVAFNSGETSLSVLSGFTLSHTNGSSYGAAVRIVDSSPTIVGNHFRYHTSNPGGHPALYVRDNSSPLIRQNLFYDNEDAHIVVWLTNGGAAKLINNTIYGGESGLVSFEITHEVRNNIITACSRGFYVYPAEEVIEDYNNVWGNTQDYDHLTPDPTDISVDPEFVDAANGNFSLQPTSPCIDAGNPAVQYNDPDGTRNDIGAVPFDQRAPLAINLNLGGEDLAHVVNHTPTIYWTFYDPSGSQTAYEVEVGTDADWSSAEMWSSGQVSSTDTSAVYGGLALQDGDTYFYRVRVNNGTVWGLWKESVFRMNSVPSVPAPVWPVGDELVSTHGVQLVLDNSTNPYGDDVSYDFEVYSDAGLTVLVDSMYGVPEQETTTNSGIFPVFPSGNQYWWRCRVFNGFETSSWSASETFTTRDPMVLQVPSEHGTIQAGIDAAQERDTVLVADGTYTGDGNRDLDFNGTNIVLLSESGPEAAVIDCQGSESEHHIGVYFWNDEDSTSVLEGFTITGAFTTEFYDTAAIFCLSSPTIRNCVVTGNANDGIFCGWETAPSIIDCIISENGAGGVRSYYCSMEMTGTLVTGNTRSGFSIDSGPVRVTNCTFAFNGQDGMLFVGEPPKGGERQDDTAIVSNCISAFNGWAGVQQYFWYWPGLDFRCSDAYGNTNGDWNTNEASAGDENGNISLDPLFCDTAAGNFHIAEESPCAPENNSCLVLMGALDVGCACCLIRGDVDHVDDINVADVTYLVAYLFSGGPEPPCEEEGNVDGLLEGEFPVTVSDLTYLVAYLFDGGPVPPPCP